MTMLQRGDAVPHFDVTNVDGQRFSYSSIWQHQNLVLMTLPTVDCASTRAYVADVTARVRDFADAQCIVTEDRVPNLAAPALLVADRWGEVVFAVAPANVADLPSPEEVIEWLTYVSHQCPECEGEVR